jgi:hypothetical protein
MVRSGTTNRPFPRRSAQAGRESNLHLARDLAANLAMGAPAIRAMRACKGRSIGASPINAETMGTVMTHSKRPPLVF